MNYYGAKELAAAFRTVRKNTIQIAEDIPEEHYGFRAVPTTRTVAETLLHVAVVPRMTHQIHGIDHRFEMEGFDFLNYFGGLMMVEKAPHTKAQVIALLKEEGDRFAGWLDTLNDEFVAERVKLPADMGSRTRFEALLSPKEHEMHHRGQLMLMERMLGITPHLTRQLEERIAQMQKAQASA